jgi:hypothetical protein
MDESGEHALDRPGRLLRLEAATLPIDPKLPLSIEAVAQTVLSGTFN